MSDNRFGNISRPTVFTKYDVAFFIYDKGSVRWTNLLEEFVESESEQHISRQRLSDYLKELCDEGLVNKTIDKKALMLRQIWKVYPIYEVPKSRKKRIEEIRNKKEIYEFVDSASPEKVEKIYEEFRRLKETEDEEIRNKKEIYEFLNSANPDNIEKLRKEIRNLKETEEKSS